MADTQDHTPGPWKVTGDGFAVFGGGHRVASCNAIEDEPTDAEWIEAEANARLIAAAPDLLAALKVASVQYGAFFSQQYANMEPYAHKYHEAQLAAIREALHKARSE